MTKTQFRAALEQLGLTQGQAAKAMGLSIRSISAYATGETKIPILVVYWIENKLAQAALITCKQDR